MNNTLQHHGILGQKWGIRRYQNEDGSLTSAGKARYNDDGKKKNPKDMSDEDLRKSNARLQAEQQYKNLSRSTATKVGASIVASASAVAVTELVTRGKVDKQSVGKMALAGALAGLMVSTTSIGGQVQGAGGKKK